MAEVEYIHICDYAFLADGGKPCVIGIFDTIAGPTFPLAHPQMAIAFKVQGPPHAVVPITIEFALPNGQSMMSIDGQVALSSEGAAFIDFKLHNIQFPEPGRYLVRVLSAGRALATQPLRVEQIAMQQMPQMPPQMPPSTPVH
jgi:Family of unknown function (DUF6941)